MVANKFTSYLMLSKASILHQLKIYMYLLSLLDCKGEGDLLFIADSSGSMGPSRFRSIRNFVHNVTSYLDIDADRFRVALIVYSEDQHVIFNLSRYDNRNDTLLAIERTPYIYGSTNTYAALSSMRMNIFTEENGDRPDVRNLCLLVTDGQSNINVPETIPEARRARREGTIITGIGIDMAHIRELSEIVTQPAEKFAMAIEDFDNLEALGPRFAASLCTGTSLDG